MYSTFDQIQVSTMTFIAYCNIDVYIENIYHFLQVLEIDNPQNKADNKKNINIINNVQSGTIISVRSKNSVRGHKLFSPKKNTYDNKFFRNSITIIVKFDKIITFKLSSNGTFQITGCRNNSHPVECVERIWSLIQGYEGKLFDYKNVASPEKCFEVMYIPCMTNINFTLGFTINKSKLVEKFSKNSEFYPPFIIPNNTYTGICIKSKYMKPLSDIKIQIKIFSPSQNTWNSRVSSYDEYLKTLAPKIYEKKISKVRFTTFLIFRSGNCILSGITPDVMRSEYDKFISFIKTIHGEITEKIEF